MSRTPLIDKEERWAEWNGNEFKVIDVGLAREMEIALRRCVDVLSGEDMSKSALIDALTLARSVLK